MSTLSKKIKKCEKIIKGDEMDELSKEYFLIEEFRPTTITQDISRLIIFFIHLYYFRMILQVFGFHPKIFLFLTTITFYINAGYFFITFANAVLHKYQQTILIKQCKINTIFRLGFTMSTVVVILYWAIYFSNPTMLGDSEYPLHFDLFLHGGNLVVLVVDRIFIDREHRYEIRINNKVLLAIPICYFSTVYSIYLWTGFAVYPLFSKLCFYKLQVLLLAGYLLFLAGNAVYKLLI